MTNDLLNAQNRSLKAQAEQRKLEARFKGMREEKEALLSEQTERFQKKTELELRIKDLREDVEKERSGRVSCLTLILTKYRNIRNKRQYYAFSCITCVLIFI